MDGSGDPARDAPKIPYIACRHHIQSALPETVRDLLALSAAPLAAQVSFAGAVSLAVVNSPRVKLAQDDLDHALAAVDETKGYYTLNLALSGGLGQNYGISLQLPTLFTVTTQSLIYSPAQRDYLRSARASVDAARLALADAVQQVEDRRRQHLSGAGGGAPVGRRAGG